MRHYDDTSESFRCLDESVKELKNIDKKLAKLLLRKEELTQVVIGALGHEHEGQRTYEHGVWKIEVKTPFIYSLNKNLYESGEINLPENFNPVKQSVSYSIDKRLCDQYLQDAPAKVRNVLVQLIDKKPGKAGVVIKERV